MNGIASEFEALAGAFQFAYVAHDVGRAARAFESCYGMSDFHIQDVTVECYSEPGSCRLRVGIAWIGDKQIESIEPVSGAIDLYVSALPTNRDAVAFHHVGVRVHGTLQDWEKRRAALLARESDLRLRAVSRARCGSATWTRRTGSATISSTSGWRRHF
jgi:hypothetical protein